MHPSRASWRVIWFSTLHLWLGAAILGAQDAATSSPGRELGEPATKTAVQVTRASSAVRIDGVMDDAAWVDAPLISLPFEVLPGDNVPPPVRTECRISYDDRALYVGCMAYDPEPRQIRANFTDRDRAVQDDHILLLIDPFGDRRRAFQFRTNPVGVQMDAIFAQGFEDFSWDAIWNSAGRITDEGYVVEMEIPFKSLRFPRTLEPQSWGIILERSYPRSSRHRVRSVRNDRSNTCLLCQAGTLEGLHGIAPGRDVEITPTLTSSRTDRRTVLPAGSLDNGPTDVDVGVSARWGMTPNISLNLAVNPDFSQVESDVAELSVNQRFAIFYPEKRPFFMEGADVFQTFAQVVFTRSVVDPYAGVKVTGKEGRHAVGAFITQDRVNALIIPSNQGSRSTLLDQDVNAAVLRYRRDIGQASTIGVVYTGREGENYRNHVAGVDAFLRLSPSNTLRAQLLGSHTLYPDAVVSVFNQHASSFNGHAFIGQFTHNSRNWNWMAQVQEIARDIRADAGFLPRVDGRVLRGNLQRVVWGDGGSWYQRLAYGVTAERVTTQDGALTDQGGTFAVQYQGARQSFVQLGTSHNQRVVEGQTFDITDASLIAEARPNRMLSLNLFARAGGEVDFSNVRRARITHVAPTVDFRLTRHLNAELGHTFQRLNTTDGQEIYTANLSRSRLVYNFSTRMFVRGMLQYEDLQRDAALYRFEVKPEQRRLSGELLFSYKVNPQTVVFLGYSDVQVGEREFDLMRQSRTLFMKLGYAWRL